MNKMTKVRAGAIILIAVLVAGLWFLSDGSVQDYGWTAPKEADELENPLANNAQATDMGELLYRKECENCHGDDGKGGWSEAMNKRYGIPDFTSKQVQRQSDGALFWKIREGKASMPAFRHRLSKTECWQLVNYIRKLKRQ